MVTLGSDQAAPLSADYLHPVPTWYVLPVWQVLVDPNGFSWRLRELQCWCIVCAKLPPTGRPSIASTAKQPEGALVARKALALLHSVGNWHLTVGGVAGAIAADGPRGARLAR